MIVCLRQNEGKFPSRKARKFSIIIETKDNSSEKFFEDS